MRRSFSLDTARNLESMKRKAENTAENLPSAFKKARKACSPKHVTFDPEVAAKNLQSLINSVFFHVAGRSAHFRPLWKPSYRGTAY